MDAAELGGLVKEALTTVRPIFGWTHDRWFAPGLNGQGRATTFAWAVVLLLADRIVDRRTPATLWAPWHGRRHRDAREQLVRELWCGKSARRAHSDKEVAVDFSVWAPAAQRQIRLTAESEMFADHETNENGDYAWDLLKLLMVPSPRRLFLARVGNQRRRQLERTVCTMIDNYGRVQHYLREGDWLGIVVLDAEPSASAPRFSTLTYSGAQGEGPRFHESQHAQGS